MKLKTGIRTTYRQPVRMLLYTLFIAFLSFGFLSHVLEYQMMYQQVEQAADYYRPVGRIIPEDGQSDVSEGVGLIDSSDFIVYSNRHYSLFGTFQDNYTPFLTAGLGTQEFFGNNMCYFEGTVISRNEAVLDTPFVEGSHGPYDRRYTFSVQVEHILSALPEYMFEGDQIRVVVYYNEGDEIQHIYEELEPGSSWLFKTIARLANSTNRIGSLYYEFVMDTKDSVLMYCRPDYSDVSEGQKELIQEDIALKQVNAHGATVHSLSDVAFSDSMQDLFYLQEGRWTTHEDEVENRLVCVVHQELADLRGYQIGDTLSLDLWRILPMVSNQTALTAFQLGEEKLAEWQSIERVSHTYKIVGIYGSKEKKQDNPTAGVFVPPSSVPEEWQEQWQKDERILASNYYFVLDDPDDTQMFLEQYEQKLLDLGYSVVFMDRGWEKFQESAQPMLQSALMGAIIYGVLMVAAMGLLAALAVLSRRKELAIMRALGVAAKIAASNSFLPMISLGTIGILGGARVSWYYISQKAEDLLITLTSMIGTDVRLQIPVWYLILMSGGVLFIWTVLLITLIHIQLKKPVLVQLQGDQGKGKQKQEATESLDVSDKEISNILKEEESLQSDQLMQENLNIENRWKSSLIHRMIRWYTFRTPGRTILVVLITGGFLAALSIMAYYIQLNEKRIDYLYQSTEISGSITARSSATMATDDGVVPLNIIAKLRQKKEIKDIYLEIGATVTLQEETGEVERALSEFNIPATFEDIAHIPARGLAQWEGSTWQKKGIQIDYLAGFDETFLISQDKRANTWVALSGKIMDQLGIELGDEILLKYLKREKEMVFKYQVIGRIQDESNLSDSSAGILLRSKEIENLALLGRVEVFYSTVRFELDRSINRNIEAFQSEMDTLMDSNGAKRVTQLVCILEDEELTMAIEPLEQGNRLMEILYPILLAVSVLVSVGVAVLMMLPRRKEAAIMRVLGTRRKQAMLVFVGGHMVSCVLGIWLALTGMWYVAPWLGEAIIVKQLICIALNLLGSLAGSMLGAWMLVSGKPLELLQVKE